MADQTNFKREHYARVFNHFDEHSNHAEIIATAIKAVLDGAGKRPAMVIDIGAGTGRLTRLVAKHATERVLALEPNSEYSDAATEALARAGIELVQERFLDWDTSKSDIKAFDLIVCSHVLYHVRRAKWAAFLSKLMSVKNTDSSARVVLVMVAPRGAFHALQSFISPDYHNSARVLDVLRSDEVKCEPREVIPITTRYTTESRDDFADLIRLFALDNSLSKEAYTALPEDKRTAIEAAIVAFVDTCLQDDAKTYCLTTQDDVIVL
jgi:SAM-dependent methyltransferase